MSKNIEQLKQERQKYNQGLQKERPILGKFIEEVMLPAYDDKIIPVQYKHLIGLAVSIHAGCEDGIIFHIDQCFEAGVTHEEIMETLQLCVIDGGTLVYPYVRTAYKNLLAQT